jgi:hypothetical protein
VDLTFKAVEDGADSYVSMHFIGAFPCDLSKNKYGQILFQRMLLSMPSYFLPKWMVTICKVWLEPSTTDSQGQLKATNCIFEFIVFACWVSVPRQSLAACSPNPMPEQDIPFPPLPSSALDALVWHGGRGGQAHVCCAVWTPQATVAPGTAFTCYVCIWATTHCSSAKWGKSKWHLNDLI